jgi:hypothetical protein
VLVCKDQTVTEKSLLSIPYVKFFTKSINGVSIDIVSLHLLGQILVEKYLKFSHHYGVWSLHPSTTNIPAEKLHTCDPSP